MIQLMRVLFVWHMLMFGVGVKVLKAVQINMSKVKYVFNWEGI